MYQKYRKTIAQTPAHVQIIDLGRRKKTKRVEKSMIVSILKNWDKKCSNYRGTFLTSSTNKILVEADQQFSKRMRAYFILNSGMQQQK